MDEQEQSFENTLFALIRVSGKYLKVTTVDTHSCSREKIKSEALLEHDRVYLNLSQSDPLEKWFDAILKAEELLGKLESKREWEKQNPILFERISAKLRHIAAGVYE